MAPNDALIFQMMASLKRFQIQGNETHMETKQMQPLG